MTTDSSDSRLPFPPALVERLLLTFDGWDGTLNPSASARRLVQLREAFDDLSHYAPWHYTAVCVGCPAADGNASQEAVYRLVVTEAPAPATSEDSRP